MHAPIVSHLCTNQLISRPLGTRDLLHTLTGICVIILSPGELGLYQTCTGICTVNCTTPEISLASGAGLFTNIALNFLSSWGRDLCGGLHKNCALLCRNLARVWPGNVILLGTFYVQVPTIPGYPGVGTSIDLCIMVSLFHYQYCRNKKYGISCTGNIVLFFKVILKVR